MSKSRKLNNSETFVTECSRYGFVEQGAPLDDKSVQHKIGNFLVAILKLNLFIIMVYSKTGQRSE
jgi:hypothetical protein